MIRRFLVRAMLVAVGLVACAFLTECALERRDEAMYTPGQTFAQVGDARIRYRLLGAKLPGTPVVFLSGLIGTIEQADHFQRAISATLPSLAYDRAGYGFSEGSQAHDARAQADELAALLRALKLEKPVVLVAYSASAQLARVFAGRFPKQTAGLYLIEPSMPELDQRIPTRHNPRRRYARFILHQLITSSLGYIRFQQRMRSWQPPASPVEQRAEAILARRPHYWALAREWWVSLDSSQQTLDARLPPALPLEVAFPKQEPEDETAKQLAALYAEFVARSSHGKLVQLEHVDHSQLSQPGPVFYRIVEHIKQLAAPPAP